MKRTGLAQTTLMNKNFYFIIGIVAFAISISGFYSCNQTENKNYKAHLKSQPAKIREQITVSGLNIISREVTPEKKSVSKPVTNSNVVIPGRTMQSAVFSPGLQNSISIEGAKLSVPAGAMEQTKNLSVIGLLAEDLPPIPAEITNVTKSYPGYRFLPHGTLFDSAASIAMAFDETLIPEGFTSDDVYTFYFDETDQKWKALDRDSIDQGSKLIVSNTLHFTDMINGIIKVPESPGTAGFAPTTMKDIKAADPAAGIALMAPPAAKSSGGTEISFPLKIPAGRAGIQPDLNLQYINNGLSNWVGYGWDLSVHSISVDVTWGVPRYDALKESETYLLAGAQLTPVAHRGEYVARSSEKRFYPRVEGDFNKIIRHGDNPTNYWWEVTAKNGLRSFYGGLPETGNEPAAVTMDAGGNISHWALLQMRDTRDNTVTYTYDKPVECGQLLYIREITYTGHAGEPGPYKISLLRNDQTNTYNRKDARIDARMGFIQRDNALLRRVNITFNNEIIRSYSLKYKDGAFYKTLLESITEFNAVGDTFYTHSFDYFDDVQSQNGYVPFANEIKKDLPDDNLKNPFLNLGNMFFDNVSALGGSGSSGGSGGSAATVGFFDGMLCLKSSTAGGNASYHGSTSDGFLTLIDINGDGLPDKVYKKDNFVYYRPNLSATNGQELFGNERLVDGIRDICVSKISGFGAGAEAHPPASFVGYNYSNTTTKTKIYFSDFNADGLVDLANNGIVYFNHIDENGNPVFTSTSGETPNPLNANSQIDPTILPDPAIEQAELEKQFPLHDAVRMWQAPYRGFITINAPVKLIENTSDTARSDKHKDGVKVSIQHKNNILWSSVIDSGNYGIIPCNIVNRGVFKGERIYFRVQSRYNGSYDQVHWDPEIVYDSIYGNDTLVKWEDINRKMIARYKASEDYVLSGRQSIGMPKTGTISIKTAFSKPYTTDSLRLEIVLADTIINDSIIRHTEYGCNEIATNDSINLTFNVNKDNYLKFRVIAPTNVDWSKIKWDTYVEYCSFLNDTTPVYIDSKPVFSFKVIPEFTTMFNNPVRHELSIIADTAFMFSLGLDTIDSLPHPMKLTPRLGFSCSYPDSNIVLSVKTKNKVLGKKKYMYNNQILNPDTLNADITFGDSVYFEYHFPNILLAECNTQANVVIGSDILHPQKASVYSAIDPNDEIFGQLYRGWGQFDYDGNPQRDTAAIDEALLKMNTDYNTDISNITDTSGLNDIQNPMGDVFAVMIPYVEKGHFMGTDEQVYVAPEIISSSRRGEKDVIVEPLAISGSGLCAVTKVSKDISHSIAGGLGVGPISGTVSHSWAENNITVDMMDMNGDHFPDLLSTNNIQYTSVSGAISGSSVNHSLGDHFSNSDATGVTLGGTYVTAKSSNSLTQVPSKGVKVIIGDNFKTNKNSKSAEETSKSTVGISGNLSSCSDAAEQTWLDINGDGLPDKIYRDGTVRLNIGYSFAPVEHWNFDAIRSGTSSDYGGGLGVNISNGSIMAGISVSKTDNEAEQALMDVNGDGLPDLVKGNKVMFNTGSGFATEVNWNGLGAIDAGSSIGQSANVGFTIGITFAIIPIKICVNPSGSVSRGISKTLTQLADIDGDAMPDFLSSSNESELYIKSSTIGRTNMLKTVHRPMGSTFTLNYKRISASYDLPNGEWTLASVKMFDGLTGDGVDTSLTTFDYAGGYHNRHERQFYGFATVKTNFHNTGNNNKVYRTLEQEFNNLNYYTKGILTGETLIDGEGRKQTGSEDIYHLYDVHTGTLLPPDFCANDNAPAYVSLDESKKFVYQGDSVPLITTRVTYSCDTLGNIIAYSDYSTGNEKDKIDVSISYHANDSRYLYSIPSKHEVSTREGLMRKRETSINEYGDITQISQLIENDQTARFDMEYDEYGNQTKITRPANYKGERMWYAYEYDTVVHSFITKVTDAYGYSSSTKYNYKWSMPVESTDMNNQKMQYTFDDCGRMQTVTGPYEIAAGKPYTISFEYHPEAAVPYAHTLHYDSLFNNIETYTFADGMGRAVQVKKTATLFNNANTDDTPGFIVSGKELYDAFGRKTSVYQPVFETSTSPDTYNALPDNIQPLLTTYDVRDRILQVTLPDGSKTTHTYGIDKYNGENVHIDTLTNALGHQSITYFNARGHQVANIIKSSTGDIITNFELNAIGELLTVTDPKGNKTTNTYDKLGRRISVNQPDAGLTEFTYDAAGNIFKKITANLRKQIPNGGVITYNYDRERLVEIVYPRNVQNRVNYTYGAPGAAHNRAGRIELTQDASGGQEFFYGPLGEVIKTIRTVQMGEADMRTWIWSASYDTWNRVQTMTYPDGEEVTYSYNHAGNLQKINGEKLGRAYNYVSRIGYDKFEKQAFLQYGNGSITTYNYEPERQRLAQMNVTSNNKVLMNNVYTYDVLNNILGITNTATATGDIGGSTSHVYSYDDLNRLIQASGIFTGNKDSSKYTLAMQYDVMGNVLHKTQTHFTNNEKQAATTYDFGYKYDGLRPNAATVIGEKTFTYDENGNQTGWEDTVTNDFRQLSWDEENRLVMISDNGYLNRYVYNASGERAIKSHGGSQGVYINGAPVGIVNHSDNNYTVYVSPYFVLQNDKFTKHYYAGSTRVTSKIGNGQFENQYRLGVFEITAGRINYINRQQQIYNGVQNYIDTLGIPPGPPTMKGIYADPAFIGKPYPDAGTPDNITPRGWPKKPVFAPAGGPPGAPIQWGDDVTNDNVEPGFGYVGTGNIIENLIYFYHSDHLSSTNYITDAKGNVSQFITYIPFGETLAEQHSDWDSPIKFNAKELDAETGLYYYGARYYDPKTTKWISPDPLAEKYYALSPYVYCSNNPVIYTDPNGKEITVTQRGDVTTIRITGKLVNNTGRAYTQEQLQGYANRMISSIQSSFTGSEGHLWWRKTWQTEANITVASDANPLITGDHADHAFRIVPAGGIPDHIGQDYTKGFGVKFGNVVYLSEDILENSPTTDRTSPHWGTGRSSTGNATLERTAAHEIGHSMGLEHPWDGNTGRYLMHQTINANAGMKTYYDDEIRRIVQYHRFEMNNGKQKLRESDLY